MSNRASSDFDLIVIGAGPAGAAAAKTAATKGLRVALIDKKRFPRHKLCGGGVTGRAMAHYQRIFGKSNPDIATVTCQNISFYAFGEDLGLDRDVPPLSLVMRHALDHALMQDALAAGALDFTGESGALDPASGTVSLPQGSLQAPLIIAADGVNSPTARQLFGQAFDRRTIGFALEIEHDHIDVSAPLRIDFGAAEWGYGWQFPKTCGTTVGLGGVMARNGDFKAALQRYVVTLGLTNPPAAKGQFLPFGAFRSVPGQGRILLAGDAAGLVDPITGEGIAHALRSGELAALATIEALATGQPARALPLYRRSLAPIHRSLRHAGVLRHIMFRPRLRPAFIRSFRGSRTLRGEYLRLLAGQTEYDALVAKTARRMPGFALRAIQGI